MIAVALAIQIALQPLDDHVNDFAGVLSDSEEAVLRTEARSMVDLDGFTVVIVVVKRLGEIGPGSLETVAKNLFNAWGIGDRRTNRGILVLLALESRDLRIELGVGFDAAMESRAGTAADIMTQYLGNGRHGDGLMAGLKALRSTSTVAQAPSPRGRGSAKSDWWLWALVAVLLFVVLIYLGLDAQGGYPHRRSWFSASRGSGWRSGRSSFGSSSFSRSSFGGGFSRGSGVSRKW